MAKTTLIEELGRRTLLCDGAMGTQLFARGLPPDHAGILWNVERPEVLVDIHTAYCNAGCDLVTTNTFQGTTTALALHGLSARARELNVAAARNARAAAGDGRWVLADAGPFGGFLEPVGDVTEGQAVAVFAEQFAALREGGADAALVETMSDPAEVAAGVKAAKSVAGWPVIATYAFERGDGTAFRTMMGTTAADAVQAAIAAGADVVGANCGTSLSLEDYVRLAEDLLAAAGSTPVIVQPNAGSPVEVDGKTVHPAMPAEMAELARKLRGLGVKIVGGCCGTSPAHLAAMGEAKPQA